MAGYDDELDDENDLLDRDSSQYRSDSFSASLVDDSDGNGCRDKRKKDKRKKLGNRTLDDDELDDDEE